jgi:glycosyltransferase involved in cell wall biosynthesis
MKISFVEPHLKLYGGIRRIIELSNRLTERGHDVTIFHSDGSPCEWMKCIAKIKDYKAVLKEEHDVIIYNDPNPIDYSLVKKAKAKLKVFYVLELYNKELLKGFNLKIYLPGNERMLILKKSLCSPYLKLSNATWEKEWLKENMNISSILLLGGVNFEMFYPIEKRTDSNEFHVLCSGDIRERKGTKTILEAFEIVKKEKPKAILDTYHGKGIPQEKMAEKYCSANVFVEGSWQAGWNNPVAEAMACKIPVVCTDIGGIKDFAFHEKTALLVPPEDPQSISSAILRLIRDEKLRETLRENAYQHIKMFDWDKSAEKLEEILMSGFEEHKFSYFKI